MIFNVIRKKLILNVIKNRLVNKLFIRFILIKPTVIINNVFSL